ncbi:hypothetical protein ADK41_28760 [Streptomyces caelestis]|uniref:Uncharacterized protein n=1 Tax=Streptomyces caelestis TaxID=36816 RepID=A0A0M8QNB3_9ACTN|nr:hypothetical protein ADK41_28760 [Streptomyces caelestis]KOV23642.1 hypothetical protein ADK58_22890 [Streptomyces sp. XY152]
MLLRERAADDSDRGLRQAAVQALADRWPHDTRWTSENKSSTTDHTCKTQESRRTLRLPTQEDSQTP